MSAPLHTAHFSLKMSSLAAGISNNSASQYHLKMEELRAKHEMNCDFATGNIVSAPFSYVL